MRDRRPRDPIAIDFDGVLYPLAADGAEALRRLRAKRRLVVFTARRDHGFVAGVLSEAGVLGYFDEITSEKGRFAMIVDDLPLCHFTGDWEEVTRAAQELERPAA